MTQLCRRSQSTRLLLPVALAGFLAVSFVGAAGATIITWSNPAGGAWSDAANWTPAEVPDSPGESAVLRHNGVPPYRETRQYVDRVLLDYERRGSAALPPNPTSVQQTGKSAEPEPSPPSVTIFRLVDADGSLTYTNLRPPSLSGALP